MSGIDNLKTRLEYNGGKQQEGRMIKDKERSLKKALLYSYQAATAVLENGKKFRCLINPDKLKMDYEDKILSIPFKDICIGYDKKAPGYSKQSVITEESITKTSQGEEDIGIKPGDVFKWEETDSYWLVYLRRIEEDAYFRAEIRHCRYEVKINDNIYKVYAAGPTRNTISWHTRRESGSWNDLDYNITMFITNNEETRDYLHRFAFIELNGKPWEVQVVDTTSTEGIIEVQLREYFSNTIEKEVKELKEIKEEKSVIKKGEAFISGEEKVYPYDEVTYKINNAEGGTWSVDSSKIKIAAQTDTEVTLVIVTGKSGKFNLTYTYGEESVTLGVKIESF